MAAVSNESNSNRNTGARGTARKKLLRRILLKVGIGVLVHQGIDELDDLLGDASEAAQDTWKRFEDHFEEIEGRNESPC